MINPFNEKAVRERNIRNYETGNPIYTVGYLGIHPKKWHAFQDKIAPWALAIVAVNIGIIVGCATSAQSAEFPAYDQECRIELQRLVCN